jgi:hypothetical protein
MRAGRPRHRDYADEAVQVGDRGGCDHQALPRGLRPAAMSGGRRGGPPRVERHGARFAFGTLQNVKAPGPFGMLVVLVLLVVAADLVRARGQFREGHGADRHLMGRFGGFDPPAQDQSIKMLVWSTPCRGTHRS